MCFPAATEVPGQFSCTLDFDLADGIYTVLLEYQRKECLGEIVPGFPYCQLLPMAVNSGFLTIRYQPPPPPDTRAPKVKAFAASGRRGTKVSLRFSVSDNSGKATVAFGIFQSKRMIRSGRWSSVQNGRYHIAYNVPRRLNPKVRSLVVCVLAVDAAGNRSTTSCARLTIKK